MAIIRWLVNSCTLNVRSAKFEKRLLKRLNTGMCMAPVDTNTKICVFMSRFLPQNIVSSMLDRYVKIHAPCLCVELPALEQKVTKKKLQIYMQKRVGFFSIHPLIE